MSLTLRLRFKGRSATLSNVPEDLGVAEFQALLASKTGVPPERQALRLGVPPVPLKVGARTLLEAGCRDRDTLMLEETSGEAAEAEEEQEKEEEPELPVASQAAGSSGETRKRLLVPVSAAGRAAAAAAGLDTPESNLLPAFDRAIAAAEAHAGMIPEDKHQVFALRKGKMAVLESLKNGNNISLGALHTLTGVGHWVVRQVKEQLDNPDHFPSGKRSRASGAQKPAAVATPKDFTWWYVDRKGKAVNDRNSAESMGGGTSSEQFKVCILHSSGRLEKAFLPEHKAPPRCPTPPEKIPKGSR